MTTAAIPTPPPVAWQCLYCSHFGHASGRCLIWAHTKAPGKLCKSFTHEAQLTLISVHLGQGGLPTEPTMTDSKGYWESLARNDSDGRRNNTKVIPNTTR